MSSKNSYALIYCSANQISAEQFESDLSPLGISFEHYSCNKNYKTSMCNEVANLGGLKFLLISENFLKSARCMADSLMLLETGLKTKTIFPIIIDSEFEEGTETIKKTTQFRRISDLINFMNFWQELYLEMRKEGQNSSNSQNENFDLDLKNTRIISGEIGEFLRLLRECEYWEMNKLIESNYTPFFKTVGKQDLIVKYQDLNEDQNLSVPSVIPLSIEETDEAIDLVLDENDEAPITSKMDDQEADNILSAIFDDDGDLEDSIPGALENDSQKEEAEEVFFDEIKTKASEKKEDLENDELFFKQVNDLFEAGKFKKARKSLQKFTAINNQNESAFFLLAKAAEELDKFEEARGYYSQLITLSPDNSNYHFIYGNLLFTHFQNDHRSIVKSFSKAIELNPYNEDALYKLAVYQSEIADKPKQAYALLLKTLEVNPNHKFANYDLALYYFGKRKRMKAAKFYEKAFEINPEFRTTENDKAFRYEEYLTKKQVEIFNAVDNPIELTQTSMSTQSNKSTIKTILITGATSGIGKATAGLFAKNGYRLILTGRREDRLSELQKELLDKYNTDSYTLNFDIRYQSKTKNAINSLPDEWQQVDILINNAGLAKGFSPVHEGELSDWETMIDTNIKGLLYITRILAPQMVKQKYGQIINVCSSAGHEVYPNGNVYCATKHAVDAITKGLRLELHKHNIRVGQISPGHVEQTEFAVVRFDGDKERAKIYNDFIPLNSHDVAEAILFMVSRPPHVTIQDIQLMGTQQASSNFIDRSGR